MILKIEACKSVVKVIVFAVENLGCQAFKSAQENACYCSS